MTPDFDAYLRRLGMTDVLVNRVHRIHEFYKAICPEEITSIFVSDNRNEDGVRVYESLWFFSKLYMMEAKAFPAKDDFDMAPFLKRIVYWQVQAQDYDFAQSNDKSRLLVGFRLANEVSGELRATRENCVALTHLFQRLIVPNLIEYAHAGELGGSA